MIFLDCGTHKGEGLLQFYNSGIIPDGTKVYCFEPIPNLIQLNNIKDIKATNGKRLSEVLDIELFQVAIWVNNNGIEFNFRFDHSSHIIESGYEHPGDYQKTFVETVDLVEFIENLNDDVICKMDIEGSEFQVLRKLVNSQEALKRIKSLYVEFHPHFVQNESQNSVQDLITQYQQKQININLWH